MAEANTCTVTVNNGKHRLECRTGLTLFAALRMHKLYLPTGCGARGQCGYCRVKLLSGAANDHTESETALINDADRLAGFRLGCQLRLANDITVEVPDHILSAGEHVAVIDAITPLTHDIRRFSFKLDAGNAITYQAGQYLNLAVKIPEAKMQAIRCFSFATQPSVKDKVDIIVRLNPKGIMTPYLFEHAKAGDKVSLIAPFGDFVLQHSDAPCIGIAGGSGLAPFIGMLEDMIEKGINNRPFHLFFGAVNQEDLYYVDEFAAMSKKHPWFKFTPALSGKGRCNYCHDYGLITDVVAKHVPDASKSEGYLCGSPGMIGACMKVLTGAGMDTKKIYFDRF